VTAYTKKILLAISDKEVAEGFSAFLKEKGFETVVCFDGASAMETALKETPILIILDLYLPVIKGERLFQILKNNPHTSRVPFFFLSESQKEVKGFRIGMDWFVTKPFQWEEMYGNMKQLLLLRGITSYSLGDKDFQGRLSQIPLADVLQMLRLNRKEGELTVTSGTSSATVFIKDGQIFNAAIGEVEKEKALFRLLSWKDGTFEFRPAHVTATQKLTQSTDSLVLEGMRQIDEYNNSKGLFPDENSLLKIKIDTSSLPEGLKPVMYEVLNLVKHYPRVKDLVDRSAFPDFEVYKTLVGLLGRHILDEIKETKRGDVPSKGIVSPPRAIKIKEKLISRWSDMLTVNFGKILVASTSMILTNRFIEACKDVPDFLVDERLVTSKYSSKNTLGDIGRLKLYGGMDIILFSVPTLKNLSPLLKMISSNVIGIIVLWDEDGNADIPQLAATRNEILSRRRVPVLHIYAGKNELDKTLIREYRNMFGLKADDPVFTLSSPRKDNIQDIFQSYFSALLKEDYISGKVRAI